MNTTRRGFLHHLALGAALWEGRGAFAEALIATPRQTEGPFFPDQLPLDTDNDLILVNDTLTPAVGEVTHLSGRILDARGLPLKNAVVEIWQVDHRGIYLHTADSGHRERDTHFQGFGRFLTDSTGGYYFRTIKPVPYGDDGFRRTPHIHFKVSCKGLPEFTTQCYVRGHALNAQDGVLRGVKDPAQRDSVLIDFAPVADSAAGELAARFDMVLGFTPEA